MKNIIITFLVTIGLIAGAVFYFAPRTVATLGGVDGTVYSYKNISSSNASTTRATVVRGGAGVLGYITINTADARAIGVYDGNGATTTGMTLIGSIKASTAEQTLFYDVAVTNGITLNVPASYAGSMTISYK